MNFTTIRLNWVFAGFTVEQVSCFFQDLSKQFTHQTDPELGNCWWVCLTLKVHGFLECSPIWYWLVFLFYHLWDKKSFKLYNKSILIESLCVTYLTYSWSTRMLAAVFTLQIPKYNFQFDWKKVIILFKSSFSSLGEKEVLTNSS